MTQHQKRQLEDVTFRESEERFSKAFHSSPVPIAITRQQDGRFIDVNESFLRMTGYSRDEVIHHTSFELNIWADTEDRSNFVQRLVKQGSVRESERIFRVKDGNLRTALLSAEAIELGGEPCLLMMIKDITIAKQNEEKIRIYQEELRSLASQLSVTEERERRRIATNLHDQIGQTLAMIKIKLGSLGESLPNGKLLTQLDEIRGLLEETIHRTRSLSFELSPPILYEVGFEAAVEWLVDQTREQHQIQVEFEDDSSSKPLDDGLRVVLFTAVRELLMNIVKHAKASKAKVAVQKVGNEVQIEVQDDGIGFELSKNEIGSSGGGGFGLFSIRERIRHYEGRMKVESSSGLGTRIILAAPLGSICKTTL